MLLVATLSSHDNASDIRTDVIATTITCRITMREMIDSNRITLFLSDEIADAADGMDRHLGAPVRELLAQAMNVNLDGIGGDVAGKAEDVILDLLLGHHPALAAHQKLEHIGLARRQHLRLVVDQGLAAAQIELEI